MKVKVGDKLPDAKVFLLEKDPKEVSVKKIINGEKTIFDKIFNNIFYFSLIVHPPLALSFLFDPTSHTSVGNR